MTRFDAIDALNRCNVPVGADFHTLSSSQVEALLVQADRLRYRKPANANGSRGRYFHAYLQRKAAPPKAVARFPGWRTMTASQRYNARMEAIFDQAKARGDWPR
jgi:hypothetical protein